MKTDKQMDEIEYIEHCRSQLLSSMNTLLTKIGDIPIGDSSQFPYGWRKAAKGRTVWRLVEESISQNLELRASKLGMKDFAPASSEVGVFDFRFRFEDTGPIYVNIKSAVENGRANKDDISKAVSLEEFIRTNPGSVLLIATVGISFSSDPMAIRFPNCYVLPVTWLPDIYVNPSNNGNLQSSKYKSTDTAIRRTNNQFLQSLQEQILVARKKKG